MRKQKHPPVRANLLDQNGQLNHQWQRWFEEVGRFFDDYRRQPDISYTANATLTTDDFGKMIVFDTSSGDRICNLMTVSSKDVFCWLTIFKIGERRLTILPDSATRIEFSSPGGRIWNDEVKRKAANVTLQLISTTQWAITGATGIWKVA